MVTLHGGNIHAFARARAVALEAVLDLSASINPRVSTLAMAAVRRALRDVRHYPDPDGRLLREQIAEQYGLDPGSILIGNGSLELIHLVPRALAPRRVLVCAPTFSEYERAAALAGAEVRFFNLNERDGFRLDRARLQARMAEADCLFLCNPNNPTGGLLPKPELLAVVDAAAARQATVVVDEAFMDFQPGESVLPAVVRYPNLIVIRSFTKFYGFPGLRIGYAASEPGMIARLRRWALPWSANHLAQAAAAAALGDTGHVRRSLRWVRRERARLEAALGAIEGVTVFPSAANFLLLKVAQVGRSATDLVQALARANVLVRTAAGFRGLGPEFVRVAVRSPAENRRFIARARAALSGDRGAFQ